MPKDWTIQLLEGMNVYGLWWKDTYVPLLLYNHIRDSMHVSVVIPSIIILHLTASQHYNVFRIA